MLDRFLLEEAAKPFRWGDTDCAATADRWVLAARGTSPLAIYGRTHRNYADADAWLAEPGGLAAAVPRVLRAAGLKRATDLRAGDVGLVRTADCLCVAIWTGAVWFSRDQTGLLGIPAACTRQAWSVIA